MLHRKHLLVARGMILVLALMAGCVAPAAEAPSEGVRPAVQANAPAIDRPATAGDSVADSHLLMQYALHRSSRYLYNPGDGARLAGAAGLLETVEH